MTSDLHDRLLIRQLVENYAGAADKADGAMASALFVRDGIMRIYREGGDTFTETPAVDMPTVWQSLGKYLTTSHVVAHHRASVTGEHAVAETRCVAHHLSVHSDLVMHIHYDDTLVKLNGTWLFQRRDLHLLAVVTTPTG